LKTLERAVFSSVSVISRWVVSSAPRTTDKVMGSTFDVMGALASFASDLAGEAARWSPASMPLQSWRARPRAADRDRPIGTRP
jgi:hypothetical protein